jgi:hypothetical protein
MNDVTLAHPKMVWLGGLAGLLPFYVSALAVQFGWADGLLFKAYSVIILSFLSGVVWWHGLQHADRESIIIALALPALAWVVMLLPLHLMLFFLAAGYGVIWAWEMLRLRHFYANSYVVLRAILTFFVILAHGWMLLI